MNKLLVCTNCYYRGEPKDITKGSFATELILWLIFFPVGLIYSLWRLSTRYKGCPKCKVGAMIPLDTPRGRQLKQIK